MCGSTTDHASVPACLAGYNAYIMLGTAAPGLPAWQTPPEVLLVSVYLKLGKVVQ